MISAVTLAVRDIPRSVRFYRDLGFELAFEAPGFASFRAGSSYLNVIVGEREGAWWGTAIFYVSDVDAICQRAQDLGPRPPPPPSPGDADWGERFFHLTDPDGHELSFARPLRGDPSEGGR